jgi:group I intron endonuclease
MLIGGVYCIENIYNGKMYIGSSLDLSKRFLVHFSLLKHGKSHNKHLQASYNAYGKEAFIYYVIEHCAKEDIKKREQFWIDNTDCLISGYNQSKNAIDNSGWNHTVLYKEKMSQDRMGSNNPAYGRKKTLKQIESTRNRFLGRAHKQETKDKMSAYRANNKFKYIGSKSGKAILNEKDVYEIKLLIAEGVLSYSKIASKYSVASTTIGGIFANRRWSHVLCKELDEYKKQYKINSRQCGEANIKSKLTVEKVAEIRNITNKSHRSIAKEYNVSSVTIDNIMNMKTWKYGV